MSRDHFTNELEARKYKIVSFLSTLFFLVGVVGSLFHVFLLLTKSESFSNNEQFFNIIFTFSGTAVVAFIRFYLIKRNYKTSYLFFILIFTIGALVGAYVASTINPLAYLIVFIMLLCTSIVLSVRASAIYSIAVLSVIAVIGQLQSTGVFKYEYNDQFLLINTLVYILLVGIGVYAVRIGYEQIEHSYNKAYEYLTDLEELNQHLDEKVKFRTKQLQESIERQADSMHSAAVMGSITKPMLHDLATPLSSLKGSYELLKKANFKGITKEVINMSNEAVAQISRIIDNARSLMDNKDLVVEFSPYEIVSSAIFVSKHELQKDNINVEIKIDQKVKITGIVALFERLIVNLIVNSIEELRQCEGRRQIIISGKNEGKYFTLSIKDTGRGIKEEYLDKVFDPDFTLKSEKNLGFGLAFVKNNVEKKFGGDISIKSKLGKFTEFILRFDREFNVSRKDPKTKKITYKTKI